VTTFLPPSAVLDPPTQIFHFTELSFLFRTGSKCWLVLLPKCFFSSLSVFSLGYSFMEGRRPGRRILVSAPPLIPMTYQSFPPRSATLSPATRTSFFFNPFSFSLPPRGSLSAALLSDRLSRTVFHDIPSFFAAFHHARRLVFFHK